MRNGIRAMGEFACSTADTRHNESEPAKWCKHLTGSIHSATLDTRATSWLLAILINALRAPKPCWRRCRRSDASNSFKLRECRTSSQACHRAKAVARAGRQ